MKKLWNIVPIVVSVAAITIVLVRGAGGGAGRKAPTRVVGTGDGMAPTAVVNVDSADLEERISALEGTAMGLVRRLNVLEKRAGGVVGPAGVATGGGGPVDAQQLAELRSDVEALLTGEALATDRGRTRLKEAVKSAQEEMVAERIEQRMAQREQQQAARFERFATEHRLSATQSQQLKKALDAENEARRVLLEQRRAAGGAVGAGGAGGRGQGGFGGGEEMRALRDKTTAEAKKILSDEQFTAFEDLRQQGGGGQPAGGAGRRGGGGAPGGGQ